MSDLHEDVFAISPDIRYVAVADGQQVPMRSRPNLLWNVAGSRGHEGERRRARAAARPWASSERCAGDRASIR